MYRSLFAFVAMTSLLLVTAPSAKARENDWVKLGERTVEFRGDHDTIEIGKNEGKFSHLRFKIEDGDLVMERIKIVFANGEVLDIDGTQQFREGERSHEISLPEGKHGRTISRVEFFYHSERRRDKATIVLFGQEHN